jgi:hypothetical protein
MATGERICDDWTGRSWTLMFVALHAYLYMLRFMLHLHRLVIPVLLEREAHDASTLHP